MINGRKRFITNAGQAGTYIVTARTGERPDGSPEISAFIVEPGTPGFVVGRLEEKLGLHASATGELLFEDCRVPADQMLGAQGEGWKIFLKTLDGGRISIGAMAVGLAQAALDAVGRVRAGAEAVRPADRLLPGRGLHDRRHGDRDRSGARAWSGAPRGSRTRAATTRRPRRRPSCSRLRSRSASTNKGVQVHGGYGYVEEYKVERFLRDAKLTEIGEGTSQIQRLVIGRKVLGLRVE